MKAIKPVRHPPKKGANLVVALGALAFVAAMTIIVLEILGVA